MSSLDNNYLKIIKIKIARLIHKYQLTHEIIQQYKMCTDKKQDL